MVKRENIIRMTAEIDTYMKLVRRYNPLTREEELKYFYLYKNGSPAEKDAALECLIMSNQRLVFSLAKQYVKGQADKILDYVNEGNIGIINALDKFDPNRGNKFITFATWYIRQAMSGYSLTTDLFLRKTNNAKIGNNIIKFKREFWNMNHREPTDDEILDYLNKKGIKITNKSDIEDLIKNSIDSILSDNSEEMTFETNPVYVQYSATSNDFEMEIDRDYDIEHVKYLLSNLDARSKEIISQLFGIGYDNPIDIEVVAENFGLTPTRINQIKNTAIKKLKEISGCK